VTSSDIPKIERSTLDNLANGERLATAGLEPGTGMLYFSLLLQSKLKEIKKRKPATKNDFKAANFHTLLSLEKGLFFKPGRAPLFALSYPSLAH